MAAGAGALGGTWSEVMGPDILQTPDGGYLVAGSSASIDCGMASNHGGLDCWLVKLNPNGTMAWQKMIGGEYNEYVRSISPTADGGYIIGGYSNSVTGLFSNHHGTNSTDDWWIVKVDGSGNQLWQVLVGGTQEDQCFAARATPDGGAIAVGGVWSTDGDVAGLNHGQDDYMVVKISNTGSVQWEKVLGGSQQDEAESVQLTADGGYIVAGRSGSGDGDLVGAGNHTSQGAFSDFWVLKLDAGGATQWQKCYGGTKNEVPYYIQNTADGGYVVAGWAESNDGDVGCNAALSDAWILKIDASGNKQWGKVMGGNYYDEIFSVQPLADGSFILGATTCSMDLPGYHQKKPGGTGVCGDYWVIKLSAPGGPAPAASVSISPAAAKICSGSASTFTATVTNTGVKPAYQWTLNGMPVGTNSPTYTAANFQNNDVLAVSVNPGTGVCDVAGPSATASVKIHLNGAVLDPTIRISSATSFICNCSPASFKATVTGGGSMPSYQWQVNGVATGINSDTWLSNGLKPTDVVTCTYSDSSGCVAKAPVVSNSLTLAPGSAVAATVSIEGPKTSLCAGSAVTFTANPLNAGPNPMYQWLVNGSPSGANSNLFTSAGFKEGDVISCTISPDLSYACAMGGNSNSNALTVHFLPRTTPAATITAPAAPICKGHLLDFTATAQNAGTNPSYQWTVDGVPVGTNSSQFSSANFSDGDRVQCVVTADAAYTCVTQPSGSSNIVTVSVLNQPDPSVSIATSAPAACAGNLIKFTANAENAGVGYHYRWMVNGAPVGGDAAVFNSSGLSDGAMVTCSVTPGAGACSKYAALSNALTETIWPMPKAVIVPADTILLYGQQVELRTELSGDVTGFEWTPAAELEDPQAPSPTTVPLRDSVHYTLTVTTANQCSSKAFALVEIYRAVQMPGAFTPNGDGNNDVFRIPPGIKLQLKEFSVFDRWGNKVFTTRNVAEGWDGNFGGHAAPGGVYVYLVVGSDLKGPVEAKGTVVLVR